MGDQSGNLQRWGEPGWAGGDPCYPHHWKFATDHFYFKSPEEMAGDFPAEPCNVAVALRPDPAALDRIPQVGAPVRSPGSPARGPGWKRNPGPRATSIDVQALQAGLLVLVKVA